MLCIVMNNIHFSFKELDCINTKLDNTEVNLQQMIENLDKEHKNKKELNFMQTMLTKKRINPSIMPMNINSFAQSSLQLNEKLTVKSLLKICDYYNIEKDIKVTKCKKQDIIASILVFESLPDNAEIVQQRYKLWSCMEMLLNDNKMKKYVIWA
jgi:hypothetical protein